MMDVTLGALHADGKAGIVDTFAQYSNLANIKA